MTPVVPIAEVPLDDCDELDAWVRARRDCVTPLIAERFLSCYGYVDGGPMPTQGKARCVVMKHERADQFPELAALSVAVYYTETLTQANLSSVLVTIGRYKAWKIRRNPGF